VVVKIFLFMSIICMKLVNMIKGYQFIKDDKISYMDYTSMLDRIESIGLKYQNAHYYAQRRFAINLAEQVSHPSNSNTVEYVKVIHYMSHVLNGQKNKIKPPTVDDIEMIRLKGAGVIDVFFGTIHSGNLLEVKPKPNRKKHIVLSNDTGKEKEDNVINHPQNVERCRFQTQENIVHEDEITFKSYDDRLEYDKHKRYALVDKMLNDIDILFNHHGLISTSKINYLEMA